MAGGMSRPAYAVFAGAFLIAFAIPFFAGSYLVTFALSLILALILAQSWDWIGGQMGYINLGHFCFYGIGAYAFAIMGTHGSPVVRGFGVAILIAALTALAVSLPLFRLRGDYFAFATLALLPLC